MAPKSIFFCFVVSFLFPSIRNTGLCLYFNEVPWNLTWMSEIVVTLSQRLVWGTIFSYPPDGYDGHCLGFVSLGVLYSLGSQSSPPSACFSFACWPATLATPVWRQRPPWASRFVATCVRRSSPTPTPSASSSPRTPPSAPSSPTSTPLTATLTWVESGLSLLVWVRCLHCPCSL